MKALKWVLLIVTALGALWFALYGGALRVRRRPMKEEFIQS